MSGSDKSHGGIQSRVVGKASGGGWAAVLYVVMSTQVALEVKCYRLNAYHSYVDD